LQAEDFYQTGQRLDPTAPAPGEAGWSFTFPIYVRLNDLDSFGHVNNTVYLTYCEMARTAYLRMATGIEGSAQIHMILARAEVDYRMAVLFGDLLRVLVRTSTVGTKSFSLEYKMLVTREGREVVACESRSVLVGYDYTTLHSTVLDPEFVAALEAFEGRRLRAE
jgi:acyl-CoA thioester hydrolase